MAPFLKEVKGVVRYFPKQALLTANKHTEGRSLSLVAEEMQRYTTGAPESFKWSDSHIQRRRGCGTARPLVHFHTVLMAG